MLALPTSLNLILQTPEAKEQPSGIQETAEKRGEKGEGGEVLFKTNLPNHISPTSNSTLSTQLLLLSSASHLSQGTLHQEPHISISLSICRLFEFCICSAGKCRWLFQFPTTLSLQEKKKNKKLWLKVFLFHFFCNFRGLAGGVWLHKDFSIALSLKIML